MGKRKTVDVAALVAKVNERNRLSFCAPAVREGWNDLVETILMETGNYNGFRYLTANEVLRGQAPGINTVDNTLRFDGDGLQKDERFAGCDDTRREYFIVK